MYANREKQGSVARKDPGRNGTELDRTEKASLIGGVEVVVVVPGWNARGCAWCRRKQDGGGGMGLKADTNNRQEEEKKRGVQARAAF